jgi:lipopolysaccharide export system permease protein
MLKLLDRSLVRSYLKAYLICLVSLMSLFVVVDLFTNLDSFTEGHKALGDLLRHVGVYYGYKVIQVFDRLCEAIVLLAAMFTVAWLQKNNELLPVLSAGVSTRRIVLPVLITAGVMVGLAVANQELVMPHVDNYVLENRRDPAGKKDIAAGNGYEANGIHIKARWANRSQLTVREFLCVIPDKVGRDSIIRLEAREARYVPPGDGPRTGGWLLIGTTPPVLDNAESTGVLEKIVEGKYFLKTQEVDFETLTRQRNWWAFLTTWELFSELSKTADAAQLARIAVLVHMRLTRPVLGLILVFMGLSVILRDQNRNVFISAGLCLILCAMFFGAGVCCKHLGEQEYLSPALAAWLPVLIFGPLSFVMFDAIHT